MELAREEARWLALDDAHVPAFGGAAGSFNYGGQDSIHVARQVHYATNVADWEASSGKSSWEMSAQTDPGATLTSIAMPTCRRYPFGRRPC